MDGLDRFSTQDWPFASQPDAQLDGDTPSSVRRRSQMPGNALFIDRLFILAGISDYIDLYPPANLTTLQTLLGAIETCPFDSLKKSCLVYYLLKEYGDKRDEAFAKDKFIPSHFTRGIDGLWALDHSMWSLAISSFSNPTVSLDFIPDIMICLATLPPTDQRNRYIMSFYQFTNPSLELPGAVLIVRAMCALGRMRAAWSLQRTFQSPDRDQLIQAILGTCFGLNDHARPYSVSLQSLSGFPFDKLEDSILEEFCTSSPTLLSPSNAMVAIHFYLNKLTGEARYIEAIRFEQALADSIQNDQDIDRVIKGIREILPEVQRNMLDLELDATLTSQDLSNHSCGPNTVIKPNYDIGQLAWDAQPATPDLPPPSSLMEAREQQQLKNPIRSLVTDQEPRSVPLSASPFLRRGYGTPTSSQNRNESQKTLLKALAFHSLQHTPSKPTNHLSTFAELNEVTAIDLQQSSDDIAMATPSKPEKQTQDLNPRSTPRFKHFIGPARLPLSKLSTGSTPAPILNRTHKIDGSPFHQLGANPLANLHSITQSGTVHQLERWPTRIVFMPRRPPIASRKLEAAAPRRPDSGPASQSQQLSVTVPLPNRPEAVGDNSSSDDVPARTTATKLTSSLPTKPISIDRTAHKTGPLKKKSKLTESSAGSSGSNLPIPRKRATLAHSTADQKGGVPSGSARASLPVRASFVLPGSFRDHHHDSDHDMQDGTTGLLDQQALDENEGIPLPSNNDLSSAPTQLTSTVIEHSERDDVVTSLVPLLTIKTPRKKTKSLNTGGSSTTPIVDKPPRPAEVITPRRSNRLHSTTVMGSGESEGGSDEEGGPREREHTRTGSTTISHNKSVRKSTKAMAATQNTATPAAASSSNNTTRSSRRVTKK